MPGLCVLSGKGVDRIYEFVRSNLQVSELTIVQSAMEDQAEKLKQRPQEVISEDKISVAGLGEGLGVHGGPGVLLAAVRKL